MGYLVFPKNVVCCHFLPWTSWDLMRYHLRFLSTVSKSVANNTLFYQVIQQCCNSWRKQRWLGLSYEFFLSQVTAVNFEHLWSKLLWYNNVVSFQQYAIYNAYIISKIQVEGLILFCLSAITIKLYFSVSWEESLY